jgi:hypothetical protein
MTNFAKTARQVADTTIWMTSVENSGAAEMNPADFQKWVLGQFKNELGPLMEASAKANQSEVTDVYTRLDQLHEVVIELADHEESYLTADVASDFTTTLKMGLEVCKLIVNFDPNDEIGKRKLSETLGEFQQAATVMLDVVEEITEEDEEEDEDAKPTGPTGPTEGSGVSDESGDPEGTDGHGEGADSSAGPDTESPDSQGSGTE